MLKEPARCAGVEARARRSQVSRSPLYVPPTTVAGDIEGKTKEVIDAFAIKVR